MSQRIITGECGVNYKVLKVYFTGSEEACIGVGMEGVESILYHTPKGEGDRHYVDAYNKDGGVTRYFNIDTIMFAGGDNIVHM